MPNFVDFIDSKIVADWLLYAPGPGRFIPDLLYSNLAPIEYLTSLYLALS